MPRNRPIRTPAPAALIAALFFGAPALSCRPAVDPAPPGPEVRLVIRTQPADIRVGVPAGTPPVVEAIGRDDEPIQDPLLTVRVTVETGSAQVSSGGEASAANGVATFNNLTLVGPAESNVRLRFTAFHDGLANLEAAVSADVFKITAGLPASVRAASTAPIAGAPDALVSPAPAIIVTDVSQNLLAGIPVTFDVTGGEGRISGAAQSTTDAAGVATVSGWVLGLPGSNQMVATVSPTLQVTFNAAVTTATGLLRVRLMGHPAGSVARVRVLKTSASGVTYDVFHNVLDSLTVKDLPFGTYQVSGDSVRVGSRLWLADASVNSLGVSATTGPSIALQYREHGRLEVTTRGLPQPSLPATVDFLPTAGATAQLFAFVVSNDAVTRGLGPVGTYNAVPRTVTVAGQLYAASPSQQVVPIPGGDAIAQVTVDYVVTTGTLTIVLAGTLPLGAAPQVDVTGPGGFHETVFMAATRSWTGLAPGPYTVVASQITVAGVIFRPTPATSPAQIAAGAETSVTVTYAQ